MSVVFLTVAENTAPNRCITLQHNGTGIDLTGSTVDLIIKNYKSGEVTNTGHQSCALTTPASGVVTYTPQSTDFPSAGLYTGDAKITYPGGQIEVLYEQIAVVVRP